jgi:hypothetical protein
MLNSWCNCQLLGKVAIPVSNNPKRPKLQIAMQIANNRKATYAQRNMPYGARACPARKLWA